MPSPNWLLPESIEDVLPAEAWRLEKLRRAILDQFRACGFELVQPPLLEYLESLQGGVGRDLDLQTFKLVDQLSGRTLGVRADMTPQVARIDAHLLNRKGVTRLCYCGSVLHALPDGLMASREPVQIGAEIYGYAGHEADSELLRLLARCLCLVGAAGVRLDLGHVGIFRALSAAASLTRSSEDALFRAVQAKDVSEVRGLVTKLEPSLQQAFLALPRFYGDASVIAEARAQLPALPGIQSALETLESVAEEFSGLDLAFDLGDLRGYRYHTGLVFSAFVADYPSAVVKGGRYDNIGQLFGRSRPATGFSLDLRDLCRIVGPEPRGGAVLAPMERRGPALREEIARLRESGEVVVEMLPGQEDNWQETGCDRRLVERNGHWQIERI